MIDMAKHLYVSEAVNLGNSIVNHNFIVPMFPCFLFSQNVTPPHVTIVNILPSQLFKYCISFIGEQKHTGYSKHFKLNSLLKDDDCLVI